MKGSSSDTRAVSQPQSPVRRSSFRRLAERLFLGSVMALIATMIDRRLRRAFTKRPGNR
jgi:hypothetical protein